MLFKGYRIPLFSSLIIWAVLWEIVGHTEYGLILPPLTKIFERIIEIVPTPSFATALFITGKAFLLGNLIAIGVGVPMGVLMGRVKIADTLILPWVNLFLSAPLSALVPVIMVLAGIGEVTIVLTVVLFVNTKHTDAYESKIKQLESLNVALTAYNKILNNNLINK